MNRLLFVVGILASGSAFALPSFQGLQSRAVDQRIHSASAKPIPTECTDFSGVWTGSCRLGDEKTKEETVTITQKGCLTIQMGTDTTQIGGLRSLSESARTEKGEPYASSAALITDWNEDHTQLKTYFNALVKVVGEEKHLDFSGSGLTRIEGGKLLVDLELLGQKISCVYDKK